MRSGGRMMYANFCRRFAAQNVDVALFPWADAQGYLLPSLRDSRIAQLQNASARAPSRFALTDVAGWCRARVHSGYTAYRLTTSSSTSMPSPGLVGTATMPSTSGNAPLASPSRHGFSD